MPRDDRLLIFSHAVPADDQPRYQLKYAMLVLTTMNALTEYAHHSPGDLVLPVVSNHEPPALILPPN